MRKTWRNLAAPIVADVLAATTGQSEKEIRAALRKAYPFGAKRQHPYKVWLDEIKRQRYRRVMTARAPKGKPLEGQLSLGLQVQEDGQQASLKF